MKNPLTVSALEASGSLERTGVNPLNRAVGQLGEQCPVNFVWRSR
jgi:hypothetical protein